MRGKIVLRTMATILAVCCLVAVAAAGGDELRPGLVKSELIFRPPARAAAGSSPSGRLPLASSAQARSS